MYLSEYAWRTRIADGALLLPLVSGTVAFSAPRLRAERARAKLRSAGVMAPALVLPGPSDVVVFLADANEFIIDRGSLPAGVRFHGLAAEVPLPPTRMRFGSVRWLTRPDPVKRWLPSAAAIHAVLSVAD
ncbi:hypothetical protein GCM10009565_52250 [Amycolatopsis albidoflavus]